MKLQREVIASEGPWLKKTTATYRTRRKAIERGRRFMDKIQALVYEGCDADAPDVVDELRLLIKELEKTL